MKTMPQAVSEHSRLSGSSSPLDDLSIAGLIDDVDCRVRIMCRMMELYSRNTGRLTAEDEGSDLSVAVSIFYEYVDRQMDTLSFLSGALDKLDYISLKTLRSRSDG